MLSPSLRADQCNPFLSVLELAGIAKKKTERETGERDIPVVSK